MRILPPDVQTRIRAVKADNRNGAVHVTRLAASALLHLTKALETMPLDGAWALLVQATVEMVQSQPSMAPLFNMSNEVLTRGEEATTSRELAEIVRQTVRDFLTRLRANVEAIVEHTLPLLPRTGTVLTHSYSTTVREVLLAAGRARRLKRVICTESRPMCEGVELARVLGEARIPVTLIVDAAALLYLSQADVALVGADTVTCSYLVNKIGTTSLALGAQHAEVPCYAVGGSEKWWPAGLRLPDQAAHDPKEVLAHPPPFVTVENFYFENTPLALFTAFITENGVHSAEELARHVRSRPVHPVLAQAVASDKAAGH